MQNTPIVMGIVNVTPDSFYAASRVQEAAAIEARVRQMVAEGASLLDVGAYSTRPDAAEVSAGEEMERLRRAAPAIRAAAGDVPLSVDTFRADVARMAVEELGFTMVNDVSGGTLDEAMLPTVARLNVSYVLMHMRGTPGTMQRLTDYGDDDCRLYDEVCGFLKRGAQRLRDLGMTADIIADPGYGFAKTLRQNYRLMARQADLRREVGLPLLVGISRKSMIYRLLDRYRSVEEAGGPAQALNGTTVLNTVALMQGADILRVHDVREAVEAVRMIGALQGRGLE